MASLAELANVTSAGKGSQSAAATSRRFAGGGVSVTISIQGDRAVTEHWATVALATRPLVHSITGQSGTFLANLAAEIHRPNIRTGDTFASINAGVEGSRTAVVKASGGQFSVDVGPTTRQARFQEFGFVHVGSGEWIQNPFMMPAADITQELFIQALIQVVEIAATRTLFSGPIAGGPPAATILGGIRGGLYSFSKFAGDLRVIGINVGGLRTGALSSARIIGDANSVMRGAIAHRITARISGRFSSGALSVSRSAVISGPSSQFSSSSQRIYNRVSGRGFGQTLRGIGL